MLTPEVLSDNRSDACVLVFDSGVGGLSVVQSVLERLPGVRIVYVADDAAFPYGTKSPEVLRQRVLDVVLPQQQVYRPDLVVVACNTASTMVLPDLRSRLTIPVVGVVPAIKPAAAQSRTHCIGLLATPATVNRPYTDQLLRDFAHNCGVVRVGSSRLVEIAEDYLRGDSVDEREVAQIVRPLFASQFSAGEVAHWPQGPSDHTDNHPHTMVDVVVLGCTHFPLLRDLLVRIAPRPMTWIDSGAAIASRVEQLLGEIGKIPGSSHQASHQLVFTGHYQVNDVFCRKLAEMGLKNINWVNRVMPFAL